MLARIVFVCLIVAGVVGTSSGPLADEPDLLSYVCLFKSDREALAAARESCDIVAEGAGYAHGVLRPRQLHDQVPICIGVPVDCPDCESPETYVCVGAGGQ